MRLSPLLLLLLGACSKKDDPAQSPPSPTSAPAQAAEPALAAVCRQAQCSGDMAQVEVWTSPQGTVERYVHHGDFRRCSHAPTTYFDGQGKELETFANRPIAADSPEHRKLRERREALLVGLQRAADQGCPAAPAQAP